MLRYEDDEVARFHPSFASAASDALRAAGLDDVLEWAHHQATEIGVPDFVLVERATRRWVMVMELKRRPETVVATRSLAQSRLYAEANQSRFRPGRAAYFAVSNLELTILGALNPGRPPAECILRGGVVESGSFQRTPSAVHQERFVQDLAALVHRVWDEKGGVQFDRVWPYIVEMWIQHADIAPVRVAPGLPLPESPVYRELQEYFGLPEDLVEGRAVLLHALLAAFLRGRLASQAHPQATTVGPPDSRTQVARAIDALRAIDFATVFDAAASDRFRSAEPALAQAIDAFTASLAKSPRLDDLARTRQDHDLLLEQLLLAVHPLAERADRGKIQTDLELARILATLTIDQTGSVLDPCCGDGSLLLGALDRLESLGTAPEVAVGLLSGVEIDRLSALIAGARVALRAGPALAPPHHPQLAHGDMFMSADALAVADHVLMNPPFLRYEDQRTRRLPARIRDHYGEQLERLVGVPPASLVTQPNLYTYYVEFVLRATRPGTRIGIVLDNKWFQNQRGRALRAAMLEQLRIDAIIEYPHDAFFADWDVATSLLVGVRAVNVPSDHEIRFIRSAVDPRGVDLSILAAALHEKASLPPNWSERRVRRGDLQAETGWKHHFGAPSVLAESVLPELSTLYKRSRRGSLEKEGGGTGAFAFPFSGRRLKRRREPGGSGPYGTAVGRSLTDDEELAVREAAAVVPDGFRGRALRNSDHSSFSGYCLTDADVAREQTLEPPALREQPALFERSRRTPWTDVHERAVIEMRNDPDAGRYVAAVEDIVGLAADLLPDERRFVGLREPYAGELIVPRKMRAAYHIQVNPFAVKRSQRQVRISSNFVSYGDGLALDPATGLDAKASVEMIAAFLVSSFGQLQLEIAGRNREGALSLEKADIDTIRVLDPRTVNPMHRDQIRRAFADLPFPIRADVRARDQPRAVLDELIAVPLASLLRVSVSQLLEDVYRALDEWVDARQP